MSWEILRRKALYTNSRKNIDERMAIHDEECRLSKSHGFRWDANVAVS